MELLLEGKKLRKGEKERIKRFVEESEEVYLVVEASKNLSNGEWYYVASIEDNWVYALIEYSTDEFSETLKEESKGGYKKRVGFTEMIDDSYWLTCKILKRLK